MFYNFFVALISVLALTLGTDATAVELDTSATDDEVIAIYATACEKIKASEIKSSVRLRATDKASFIAVQNIAELTDYKKNISEHDFNVLVYNLVDNSIEDLAIRTTSQDDEDICVEVTGYIPQYKIIEAISNSELRPAEPKIVDYIEPQIQKEVQTQEDYTNQISPDNSSITSSQATKIKIEQDQAIEADIEKRSLVFVAPTKFYNNTYSDQYAEIIKKQIDKLNKYYVTDKKELADYLINSTILRAKVDPINQSTNRIQMVVSVELVDLENKSSTVEHKNQFELFANEENEQDVAFNLMKKLLEKANEQIINKLNSIDSKRNKNNKLPNIITPNK